MTDAADLYAPPARSLPRRRYSPQRAWAPLTATLGGLAPETTAIRPGKGIHVFLDRRLTNYAIITSAVDGRQVFLLPWQNMSVLGTTDDDYYGDLDDVLATAQLCAAYARRS